MAVRKQKVAAAPVQPEPAVPVPPAEKTPADELWEKIGDLPLELYSLPDQTLSGNCTRVKIAPDQLHLKLNSGAVVAALADALKSVKMGDKEEFEITTAGAFTVIKVVKTFF